MRAKALAKICARIQEGEELDPEVRLALLEFPTMALTTWAFVLGVYGELGVIALDEATAYFPTREAAVEEARRHGMAVDQSGTVTYLED
jgi:hypothetical protein